MKALMNGHAPSPSAPWRGPARAHRAPARSRRRGRQLLGNLGVDKGDDAWFEAVSAKATWPSTSISNRWRAGLSRTGAWSGMRVLSGGADRLHAHLRHQRHALARLERLLGVGGVAVEPALLDALHDGGEAEEGEGEAEIPVRDVRRAPCARSTWRRTPPRSGCRAPCGRRRRGRAWSRGWASATACTGRRGPRTDGRWWKAPSRSRPAGASRPA